LDGLDCDETVKIDDPERPATVSSLWRLFASLLSVNTVPGQHDQPPAEAEYALAGGGGIKDIKSYAVGSLCHC